MGLIDSLHFHFSCCKLINVVCNLYHQQQQKQTINSYFQRIIDEVTNKGGDVLKFAGDAIFAEWRVDVPDNDKNNANAKNNRDEIIYQIVLTAATCGADIVAKCSEYPVFDDDGSQISTLNVHCGLAYGKMAGVHVGNDHNRREFIVLGESIDQVTKACNVAKYGELYASPEAYKILEQGKSQSNKRFPMIIMSTKTKDVIEPIIIASRNEIFFENKKLRHSKGKHHHKLTLHYHKESQVPFDKLDLTSLKYLQKLLHLYVHPVVVGDESSRRKSIHIKDAGAIQEKHRSEAELRLVYTLFIKPIVQPTLTDDPKKNKDLFDLLNGILNVTTSVLDGFKGHLRQFIVDDKGRVLVWMLQGFVLLVVIYFWSILQVLLAFLSHMDLSLPSIFISSIRCNINSYIWSSRINIPKHVRNIFCTKLSVSMLQCWYRKANYARLNVVLIIPF